jgi:hypothetical protein
MEVVDELLGVGEFLEIPLEVVELRLPININKSSSNFNAICVRKVFLHFS